MPSASQNNEFPRVPSGRRDFLKAASAVVLGVGALLTAPLAGLRAWLQPLRRSGKRASGSWVRVARLSALPDDNVPRRFPVVADRVNAWTRVPKQTVGAVYLLRKPGEARVQALSVICPHAGCLVDYTPGEMSFLCPCHNSRFALDGRVNDPASPSPRGLDGLETEVRRDDEIWVRFQTFRFGIREKQPIG